MIHLERLTKQFSNQKGIFDVSLHVNQGEVFGFLGPNGAGKSTTIRHLMGFIQPDQGSSFINGLNTWKEANKVQEIVGYLPGEISFLDDMSGIQFLELMTKMKGIKDTTYRNQLIELLQFDPTVSIRKMSKGMKQKVGIVTAFMNRPDVLVLDEPTSGLDPLMQQIFIDLLIEHKKMGTTIFMSSHIFSEIERVCDRIAIIKDGRIVKNAPIEEVQKNKRHTFSITVSTPEEVQHIVRSHLEATQLGELEVQVVVTDSFQDLFQLLSKMDVISFKSKSERLEDLFMNYYQEGGESI
ncbi:ABC transporter ATP-binding protein [Priestia flexa]|jgi:ABC-2 type transport system ATP-binding protein|uniref:ABC transporter ATP-binding protein n=1 Tax=Priestia flexa TaxID=86664 RepID=A0A8I1SPE2_9BACI|nr:ABC transporter ATP-binding protein [Priestia flexa]MBN8252306.1 ABC transporter ATP-binding protein [Priestia flexa]MBN8435815.1 ABC transporter ATP-binding protein [Priestia flexa]MCA0968372.1 ABC transporter ATP-binding protein [Priestia flexa]UIR28429.1 ABC transporter ATP-binding protein [Priestia flexa]